MQDNDLVRFSIAVPAGLLRQFDEQIERTRGDRNRSEAVRDLIRSSIVREKLRTPEEEVIGSLTMTYDHHAGDLTVPNGDTVLKTGDEAVLFTNSDGRDKIRRLFA